MYKGRNLEELHFSDRRRAAKLLVKQVNDNRLCQVRYRPEDVPLREWVEAVARNGREGVIFCKKDAPYRAGARVRTVLKWKPNRDYDVMVAGLGKPTKTMPANWARMMYGWSDGEVVGTILGNDAAGPRDEIAKHLGKVVTVRAKGMNPQGGLAYPRLLHFRPDKVAADCDKHEGVFVEDF